MTTVEVPLADEVALSCVGRTSSVVGSSAPVTPRMSSVQLPNPSTGGVARTGPAAVPFRYVSVMVWLGTVVVPVTTQRFCAVVKVALVIAMASAAMTFTVTVAGVAGEAAPEARPRWGEGEGA